MSSDCKSLQQIWVSDGAISATRRYRAGTAEEADRTALLKYMRVVTVSHTSARSPRHFDSFFSAWQPPFVFRERIARILGPAVGTSSELSDEIPSQPVYPSASVVWRIGVLSVEGGPLNGVVGGAHGGTGPFGRTDQPPTSTYGNVNCFRNGHALSGTKNSLLLA